jgi:predicted DNA-binding protein YlxM (UPF0122 family)
VRWLAYRTFHGDDGNPEIPVRVYDVTTPHEQFALAVELNSQHGYQLSTEDKKQCAIRLYEMGYSYDTICKTLSVRKDTVSDWLSRTVKEKKDREDQRILDLWFACHSHQEIADRMQMTHQNVTHRLEVLQKEFQGNQIGKTTFQDWLSEGVVPLYNIWKQQDKSAGVGHFGNSEPRWLENLLYAYTEPFGIVVDPCAGSGSTIDVCKRRGRRYYVSDRKPIVAREHEIRCWDLTDGLPKLPRWRRARPARMIPAIAVKAPVRKPARNSSMVGPFPPQTFHALHLMISATADTLRSVAEPQAWRHARHKQRYQILRWL